MTQEMVQRYMDAFANGDTSTLETVLDDDFVFAHEKAPEPMSKADLIKTAEAMHKAFPDWDFHASYHDVGSDRVTGTVQITATHKGTLDVPVEGIPKVQATNKKISLPKEKQTWLIENGKITRHEVAAVEGGGFEGILKQIGAAPEAEH